MQVLYAREYILRKFTDHLHIATYSDSDIWIYKTLRHPLLSKVANLALLTWDPPEANPDQDILDQDFLHHLLGHDRPDCHMDHRILCSQSATVLADI